MWYSHLSLSLLFGLFFVELFPVSYLWIFLLLVTVFGLVPDIDSSRSKIGRKLPGVSHIINWIFGHRKMFHSLLVPIVVLVLGYVFRFEFVGWAFFVGFVGHLIGDAMTKEGINFLYPFSNFKISGFFRTGGFSEKVLFVVILLVDIFLLLRLV